MSECNTCNHKLKMNTVRHGEFTFCDDRCRRQFALAVADRCVGEEEIDRFVLNAFNGSCPICLGEGPIAEYGATKLTGMILAVQTQSLKQISCKKCGKNLRFGALGHNLAFGWWSPRSLVANIILVPYTLSRALCTSSPRHPSKGFRNLVKTNIGLEIMSKMKSE